MGCNSHNHPSVSDLLSPLIIGHGAGGEQTQQDCGPPGLGLYTQNRVWASVSFRRSQKHCHCHITGMRWGKAQEDSELSPLAPASSIPTSTSGSRDWGGHPFQAHALVSSSQQTEAVNIDSLLFEGFLMPSHAQELLSAPVITNLQSKCVLMGRRATLAPTNHP